MDGHQPVLSFAHHDIALSCTCRLLPPLPGRHREVFDPIEIRPRWTTAEILKRLSEPH